MRNKCCLLVFCGLLFGLSSVFAADASDETKAAFETVIKAHNAMKNITAGQGTAFVEICEKDSEKKASVADFMFKGNLSRSALFSTKDGKQDKLESLWALGKDRSIFYNGRSIIITKKPRSQYFHQVGYDFNPNTFNHYYDIPFPTYLERVLAGPSTLSTKTDPNGILHLITEYRNEKTRQDLTFSVDTKKEYRLVNAIFIAEYFKQPDHSFTQFLELNWGKTKTSWYITSAKVNNYAGAHSSPKEALSAKATLMRSVNVKVTEFHPDVEVDDSVFTVDGLGLPAGTRVIDRTKDEKSAPQTRRR